MIKDITSSITNRYTEDDLFRKLVLTIGDMLTELEAEHAAQDIYAASIIAASLYRVDHNNIKEC